MDSNELTGTEKLGTRLFLGCLVLWGLVWVYMTFLFEGTAEEEMWAPIAGFFMGLVFGGFLAIVPAIYAGSALKQAKTGSARLKLILVLSVIWFGSVCLMYIF